MIKTLDSLKDWENIFSRENLNNETVIFKTSHRCAVSHFVKKQFKKWMDNLKDDNSLTIYEIDVIFQRDISNQIAADTRITHQSPQVIWLNKDKTVKCNFSHGDISVSNLSNCLSGHHSNRKNIITKLFG